LVLTACAVFGAVDQYVGSLTRFWAPSWQVSALSAPWLVLPFLVGWTQRRPARGAIAGTAGTLLALAAYGAMTVSPIEHASFTVASYTAFVRSNLLWFAGSLITGPLFGWLGHRWRVAHAPYAAALTSLVVLFEPIAHRLPAGRPLPLGVVTTSEAVIGFVIGALFSWQLVRGRRSSRDVRA
jgi:hypothetical protein